MEAAMPVKKILAYMLPGFTRELVGIKPPRTGKMNENMHNVVHDFMSDRNGGENIAEHARKLHLARHKLNPVGNGKYNKTDAILYLHKSVATLKMLDAPLAANRQSMTTRQDGLPLKNVLASIDKSEPYTEAHCRKIWQCIDQNNKAIIGVPARELAFPEPTMKFIIDARHSIINYP